jgi:hypothetical protein
MSGHQAYEYPDAPEGSDSRGKLVTGNQDSFGSKLTKIPLVVGFIVAFGISWLAVLAVGFSFNSDAKVASPTEAPSDEAFAQAVSVTGVGTVLRVDNAQTLNPSTGDFLLFAWFKLKNPLQDGDRAPFLGKYDENSKSKAGYALALVGGADGVRPHVFWQNEAGQGRWYAFASTQIKAQEWYLFAVTFRAQRYLGVHVAEFGPKVSPEVLGGYDLEGQVLPSSSAPLEIGAAGTSKFRGRVGPFGVLHGLDVARDAGKIIKEIARNPESIPELVDPSQIAIWANPRHDLGPAQLDVVVGRRAPRQ